MIFHKYIIFILILLMINIESGCASRAVIKEYTKAEWVYLGRGADLEKFLMDNKIIYEVNPLGGILIKRSTYEKIKDQIRTGVILCIAIPFDVAAYPLQLIGLDQWSSSGHASGQPNRLRKFWSSAHAGGGW